MLFYCPEDIDVEPFTFNELPTDFVPVKIHSTELKDGGSVNCGSYFVIGYLLGMVNTYRIYVINVGLVLMEDESLGRPFAEFSNLNRPVATIPDIKPAKIVSTTKGFAIGRNLNIDMDFSKKKVKVVKQLV